MNFVAEFSGSPGGYPVLTTKFETLPRESVPAADNYLDRSLPNTCRTEWGVDSVTRDEVH